MATLRCKPRCLAGAIFRVVREALLCKDCDWIIEQSYMGCKRDAHERMSVTSDGDLYVASQAVWLPPIMRWRLRRLSRSRRNYELLKRLGCRQAARNIAER